MKLTEGHDAEGRAILERTGRRAVLPLAIGNELTDAAYLALGMIATFLRSQVNEGLLRSFDIERVLVTGPKGFPHPRKAVQPFAEDGAIIFFSSYVWNHDRNLKVARFAKSLNEGALIVMGGPEIPKFPGQTETFLEENPFVDVVVLGEGEQAAADLLVALSREGGLENVSGIAFRDGENIVRTKPRSRIRDIGELPSPYTTGEFEPWFRDHPVAILETNRGCPYGCTYCDWGSATLQKVTRFDMPRVRAEIEYIAKTRSQSVFVADANLGIFDQDIEVARTFVEMRKKYGYPKRLYTNFAKNGGPRLKEVIRTLHRGGLLPTGIIAVQTTDADTLSAIKRSNIKTSAYEELMEFFNDEGIPMASDLMVGLPGQTLSSYVKDLQFCFDWKISANANFTTMMPNAPMAEEGYRREFRIETDEHNIVRSTSTFTEDDHRRMKQLTFAYVYLVRFGLLRYHLYYLQATYGLKAMDVIARFVDAVALDTLHYPTSAWLVSDIRKHVAGMRSWVSVEWKDDADAFFKNYGIFLEEFTSFVERDYDVVPPASELRTISEVQKAVIPAPGRRYPHRVGLEHDAEAYFRQVWLANSVGEPVSIEPLSSFGPVNLTVGLEEREIASVSYNAIIGHADDFEMPSPMRPGSLQAGEATEPA